MLDLELSGKALRKIENSKFCTFAKIGIIWLPKLETFLKIIGSFIIAKFLQNLTKILTKIEMINGGFESLLNTGSKYEIGISGIK
jgi:hypothetical protein